MDSHEFWTVIVEFKTSRPEFCETLHGRLIQEVIQHAVNAGHGESSFRAVADKLVQIAQYYSFDRWLINIKNKLSESAVKNTPFFLHYLTYRMHQGVPESLIIRCIYMLKAEHFPSSVFFDSCDGFFTNYSWMEDHLERMVSRIPSGWRMSMWGLTCLHKVLSLEGSLTPTRFVLNPDATGNSIFQASSLRPEPLSEQDSMMQQFTQRCGTWTLEGWQSRCFLLELKGCLLEDIFVNISQVRPDEQEGHFLLRIGEVKVQRLFHC
ncbi:UNVERIFIED_CONTAM: hypothetical protein FKN15_042498 [Acipenser sinensis]